LDTAQVVTGHPSAVGAPVQLPDPEFGIAYTRHRDAVRRLASQTCGPVMAEEVTQEVFLHYWAHPGRFDPARGTLRNYLLTIARNTAVDFTRSEEKRRAREHRTARPVSGERDGVEAEIIRREEADWIAGALAGLRPAERTPLVLAFWGERTYRETAAVLDRPEGTTKSQIRLGLRHLRAALDPIAPTTAI
jgi:RNA polymerase sigma factor (sigma-70 family)